MNRMVLRLRHGASDNPQHPRLPRTITAADHKLETRRFAVMPNMELFIFSDTDHLPCTANFAWMSYFAWMDSFAKLAAQQAGTAISAASPLSLSHFGINQRMTVTTSKGLRLPWDKAVQSIYSITASAARRTNKQATKNVFYAEGGQYCEVTPGDDAWGCEVQIPPPNIWEWHSVFDDTRRLQVIVDMEISRHGGDEWPHGHPEIAVLAWEPNA